MSMISMVSQSLADCWGRPLFYLISRVTCRGQCNAEASYPQANGNGRGVQAGGVLHLTHDQSQCPTAVSRQAVSLHL